MVGTWSVVSSCLLVSGQLDLSPIGIGCPSAVISNGYRLVTGKWTAYADGTYVDATTTTGVDNFELAASCLNISGARATCGGLAPIFVSLGYSAVSCVPAPEGGCACSANVKQSGGLGIVSIDPSSSGNFSTSDNTITLDGQSRYPYCAAGTRLTLTPKTENPTLSGNVEFERER